MTTRFRDTSDQPAPTVVRAAPTSTLGIVGGKSVLSGRVLGPNGPVAGAVVRVERIVVPAPSATGPAAPATETLTAANGTFAFSGLVGGRLTVRAWKAPTLALVEEQIVFVGDRTSIDLTMESFEGTTIRWSSAPDVPRLGRRVNLAIQVAGRTVNQDGFVGVRGVTETEVRLTPLGGLQPTDDVPRITDEEGRVVWELVCRLAGPVPLLVTLATGEQTEINPPDCVAPAPPSTEPGATVVPLPDPDPNPVPETMPNVPGPVPQPVPVPTGAPPPVVPDPTGPPAETAPPVPVVVLPPVAA